ncbi:PfkB family carbohydrate kinase [Paracoccus liaowanqingii]|nr:PfkB family carbohydrate kinase [Paracoccus liaowanqingii]
MEFLCTGEPLIEVTSSPETPGCFDRRAGGDMLNTAIHLARLTASGSVGDLSRLGDDAMSGFLRDILAEEGITDLCTTQPGGRPGRVGRAGPGRYAGALGRDLGNAAARWARQSSACVGTAAVDTTGAGDSFNAGWLAARQAGLAPADTIARAARLAAEVVQHPGAILPRQTMPAIEEMSE